MAGVLRERTYSGRVGKLILLFTVVPFLETYLLYVLGTTLGFLPTIGIVLFTGVVGAWLAKREGLKVITRWRSAMARGKMPEEGVVSGLLVLVGGVLLVTPGVLTDLTGFLLLIPKSRKWIAERVKASVEKRFQDGVASGSVRVVSFSDLAGSPGMRQPGMRRPGGAVIDVEGEEIEAEAVEVPNRLPKTQTSS